VKLGLPMDRSEKSKLPKKLAMLSVPLAMASPVVGDLPATASPSSEIQKNSDAETMPVSSATTEITSSVPEVSSPKAVSSYRVRSGDTVSQIAKRFGVSVSKIARLNHLGPTSLIRVGQTLRLTGPSPKKAEVESYRVKAGDNLSSIAKRHGLTLQELTAVNRISSSTIIFPGQVLRVAKLVETPAPAADAPDSYQVQAGDTLGSIGKIFGLSISALREFNGFSRSSIIYVGQVLSLKPRPRQSVPAPAIPVAPIPSPVAANPAPSASLLSDQVSTVDPMRPTGACAIHGFHIVRAGETVSRIAAVYGVSTQSVLSANSLSWSSTIYVGQRLSIPGVHEITHCPSITKLTPQMRVNAEIIHRVGRQLGVSDYGIAIALATAMQESSLINIDYGDRDSVGLFQQRPSQGWGTVSQIMDPEYSARAFFGGPTGPNFGKIRGLLDIKNWQTMTLTRAAQAVQISAIPDAYQKWELSAWSWLDLIEAGSTNG
jgi:LysM repeat protein